MHDRKEHGDSHERRAVDETESTQEEMQGMVSVGLLVRLKAKPGKEDAVANFLEGGLALVQAEPDTTAWFAIRFGPSEFGIFDAFPDDSGRQAHLSGRVAEALTAQADELFSEPPDIQPVDVIADKLPA